MIGSGLIIVNHAHLVPEGIAGFVDALDMSRVEEVRLAICFRNGHYTNAFGALDDRPAEMSLSGCRASRRAPDWPQIGGNGSASTC